jgi:hypothetical protein
MAYKALTTINLPFHNGGAGLLKRPGDTITKAELKEAQQSDEDIAALLDGDGYPSMAEDMDMELHPSARPVPANAPSVALLIEQAKQIVEFQGDDAPAEVKRLAKLDHQHVVSGDAGRAQSDVG